MFELVCLEFSKHSFAFRYGSKAIFIIRRKPKSIYKQRLEDNLVSVKLLYQIFYTFVEVL